MDTYNGIGGTPVPTTLKKIAGPLSGLIDVARTTKRLRKAAPLETTRAIQTYREDGASSCDSGVIFFK